MDEIKTNRTYSMSVSAVRKLEELARLLAHDGERPNQSEVLRVAIDRLYSDTVQVTQAEPEPVTGTA